MQNNDLQIGGHNNLDMKNTLHIKLFINITMIIKMSLLEIFADIFHENPSDFYIKYCFLGPID